MPWTCNTRLKFKVFSHMFWTSYRIVLLGHIFNDTIHRYFLPRFCFLVIGMYNISVSNICGGFWYFQFPGTGDAGLAFLMDLCYQYPRMYRFWVGFFHPAIRLQHPDTLRDLMKMTGKWIIVLHQGDHEFILSPELNTRTMGNWKYFSIS